MVAEARDDPGLLTPVRTFVPVRRTSAVLDCVEVAIGVAALVLAYVREDYSLVAIALEVPVVGAIYIAISTPWQAPELERVVAVPPNAVIVERRLGWAGKIVAFIALGLLVPYFLVGDGSTFTILGCLFLAAPAERAVRRRTLAKWESEHGLELLRERWDRRRWRDRFRASPPYYVRPRTTSVPGA